MGTIDHALLLRPKGDHCRLAYADPDHESISGMFGGWTAGVCLGAAMEVAAADATPSAMTINFVESIPSGVDVLLEVMCLKAGRTVEHWRVDARVEHEERVRAAALVVLTSRRYSEPHLQFTMPRAPDPSGLEMVQAPPPQGLQVEERGVSGAYASGDTATSHWLKDVSGAQLTYPRLAYFCDQYAPRSFFWGSGFRPSATLTMSIYFTGTAREIEAAGTDYLLNEAIGTRGEGSTSGSQARIWSRQGALLATTEQLTWYR